MQHSIALHTTTTLQC